MTIAPRHGFWFAPLIKIPGIEVPTGPLAAARIIMARRDGAPVLLDVIGIGTSVYDKLIENNIDVEAMIGNQKTNEQSKDGLFWFRNTRALWWWRLREGLDPDSGNNIQLPPDKKMAEDLAAFTYTIGDGSIVQVESKKEAKIRLNRSPDAGDAVIYANAHTQTLSDLRKGVKQFKVIRSIGGKKR
jgi:hypothetical protein